LESAAERKRKGMLFWAIVVALGMYAVTLSARRESLTAGDRVESVLLVFTDDKHQAPVSSFEQTAVKSGNVTNMMS
jgi:hypothetical protein